jgi:hypothetical protein
MQPLGSWNVATEATKLILTGSVWKGEVAPPHRAAVEGVDPPFAPEGVGPPLGPPNSQLSHDVPPTLDGCCVLPSLEGGRPPDSTVATSSNRAVRVWPPEARSSSPAPWGRASG